MKKKDLDHMQLALKEGLKGRLSAAPNPWVGAVIVKDNEVIGRGFHRKAGTPHAEIHALREAGERARGATVYCTLEPCSHEGRTGSCAKALIRAGVARVVTALTDPDSQVAGRGHALLREAGIEAQTGVLEEDVKQSLLPYLHHRQTGLPYVVLKVAGSIDGCSAAEDGSSQWITCEEARKDAHQIRAESQAVMVGKGTALADNPQLTVRHVACAQQPLRVVLASDGQLPPSSSLFSKEAPTLIYHHSDQVPHSALYQKTPLAEDYPGLDLQEILRDLGKRGILQLMVEGGSHLLSTFIHQDLAQKLVLYQGPCLLGGKGLALFPTTGIRSLSEAPRLTLDSVQQLGQSLRLEYTLNQSANHRLLCSQAS